MGKYNKVAGRPALRVSVEGGGGEVRQVIPDYTSAQELLDSYKNFSGVSVNDFVTRATTSNGQAITALSGSPFFPGESTIVLDEPVLQPCALEIEASVIRSRHQFGTVSLFSDPPSGTPDLVPAPINITSIHQSNADNGAAYSAVAGTIVTVVLDTALTVPGLPGGVYLSDWVNIDGLVDNRLCYPNLAIKYISADRKTFTAGFSDDVALPSLAIAAITPALGSAKVYFYNNMSGAHDGAGFRFTGLTATSAAILTLFGGGDVQISGTLLGDHRTTIGSTAPSYVVGVNGNYEIKASSRFRIEVRPSEVAFLDKGVDNITIPFTPRLSRTGVKPATQSELRARFRLFRPRSMSRPVGEMISATKAGSAIATVTMDVTCASVGLVTGSYVTVKGARDVTNFAPLTTPVAITVTGANTFTLTWGGVFTGTTYGGTVILANGSLDISSAIGQTIQSISVDAVTGWATAIGNTTWAGLSVGDYVDIHGVRADVTGADLGCDGAWEVASLSGTSLVLRPITNVFSQRVTPSIASLASTNCGGTVLLRTTLRSHDLMLEEFSESKQMIDGQGTLRQDKALPVAMTNTPAMTINSGTITTVGALTGGGAAEDAAAGANPVIVGGVIRTAAAPATFVAGDAARATMTSAAAMTVALGAPAYSAEVASAARSTSSNSGTISVPTGGSISGLIEISAASGTSPTLDIIMEESLNNGTTWRTAWSASRATGVTSIEIPAMKVVGLRRWVWAIGGTGPSFTFAINVNQLACDAPIIRSLIDRSINPNTNGSASAALNIEGCSVVSFGVSSGAGATTNPTYQVWLSDDNSFWYGTATGLGFTIGPSAGGVLSVGSVGAKFARIQINGAGVSATHNFAWLRAASR